MAFSGVLVAWASWWWLRSPGNNTNNAANVNNDGNVNVNGNNVNNDNGGVRPALPRPHLARNLAVWTAGLCNGAKESNPLLAERPGKQIPAEKETQDIAFPLFGRRAGNVAFPVGLIGGPIAKVRRNVKLPKPL